MNCFSFEMTKQWLFFSSVFVFNFYFKLNYEGIINTEFFFPQLIIIYPLLGIKKKKKKQMSFYFQTSNPAASFKKLQTHIYTPAEILTLCPHAQTVGCGNVDDWSPSLSQSCQIVIGHFGCAPVSLVNKGYNFFFFFNFS